MATGGIFLKDKDSFRFQIITRFMEGNLSRKDTALLLKVSERTVSRLSKKVQEKGIFGIQHGNTGKRFNSKYSDEFKHEVLKLLRTKYRDFSVAHFKDMLEAHHDIKINYWTLWGWCKAKGLVKKTYRKRRSKAHTIRRRMPQEGLLLQLDGSPHKWNGKEEWCLISAIDDATSDIPYAEFFKSETTVNCLKVLKKIIDIKGVPKAIYTDKAGWTGGHKRSEFSQFQRACDQLGIKLIYAHSPQAKGRIERSFGTLQGRLVPELRLKNIKTMKEANAYLQNEFIPKTWRRKWLVKPVNPESAYTHPDPWMDSHSIFCIEERRKINSDQTIWYKGHRFILKLDGGSLGGLEACIRTGLDRKTRVYVMENIVSIKRFKTDDSLPVASEFKKAPGTIPYASMWKTVTQLKNRLVEHKVLGKPLSVKNLSKEAC